MTRITEIFVARARPRARKYEVSCSRTPGLVLRVLPSGKRVFLARFRDAGKDRRVRIGTPDEVTLAQARARAIALASGGPVGGAAREDSIRFAALADEYLQRHVETDALRPATKTSYRAAIRALVATFGAARLTEIRFADVERFHRGMGERPGAANNCVRVMSHMFHKAAQWELYPWDRRVPTAGLRQFPGKKLERFLSPAERRRLERVLRAGLGKGPRERGRIEWFTAAAIRLLSLTGMRLSEVLDLEWSWIDRRNRVVVLPASKTGRSVRPISGAVLELLDALEADGRRKPHIPHVVYGLKDKRITRSAFWEAWRKIRRRAGLDDVRIHDLRHSAASDALNAGVPLEVVGAILGHASIKTTQRYAHLANDVVQEATDRMAAAITGRRTRRK